MAIILEEEWDLLVWKLLLVTKEGLLTWSEADSWNGDGFDARTDGGIKYRLRSVDEDGNFPYRLEVFKGPDDELIDFYVTQPYREGDGSPSEALAELYPLVGRKVTGAEDSVTMILSDLDALIAKKDQPF